MIHEHSHKQKFTPTLHDWFLVSCGFSLFLLAGRVIVTGSVTYFFLLWNLFLALIPYVISYWLHDNGRITENKLKLSVLLIMWLLFIPNTFYILTDLFHLDDVSSAPKWFDLLLLLSFAWNGLLFGIASLRKMEGVIHRISGRGVSVI